MVMMPVTPRSIQSCRSASLRLPMSAADITTIGELARSFDRMAERSAPRQRGAATVAGCFARTPVAIGSYELRYGIGTQARKPRCRHDRMKSEINRPYGSVSSLLEVTRSEGDPLARKQQIFRIADLL